MNGGRRCRCSPVGGTSVRESIPVMQRANPRTTSSRIAGTTLPAGTIGSTAIRAPGRRWRSQFRWEVLTEQAVGVLVGSALPGRVRVAEEDVDAGVDVDLFPVADLGALVAGQRAARRLGERLDLARERRGDVSGR